ncbi:adenylyl-sulfate kinase [Haliangium sp.]|uniref:adenylyl-sulfate kinase n=1 Tax=Haliangium sp. TaxID=2663208 RepID=UPI003D0FAB46
MTERGVVVWLTGRPAAGKSTLATATAARLRAQGRAVCVLDSDEVRAVLVPPPGYDERAREDFYRTLGRLAAYVANQGLVVLVPATANRRDYREWARTAAPAFVEVYVCASSDECARRDIKGLYAKARAGEVHGLPGVDAVYEEPEEPDVLVAGGHDLEGAERILAVIARATAD